MSYYAILNTLKTELEATNLVNTVTEGDIFRVDLSKQTIFPLAHIMINNATFENNVIRYNVSIIAMDIVDISKDETTDIFVGNDNEQDVLNTQVIMLNRVYDKLRRGDYFLNSGIIDGNPTLEPFIERFENNLAGWTMTFDYLVSNEMTICDTDLTVNVYSQIVEFNDSFMNSIIYRCNGEPVAYSYGQNQPNLIDLIAMFNQNPPVQESATFLEYGICYDNGDGRVRMEMTQQAYNTLSCGGTLTLDVIYD